MKKLRPRFKLWLSSQDAEGVFGDGKWRLLEHIDSKGSLSAAAESLGISYRKAWGDLKKAEKCLGKALIERHRGGAAGGSTSLTEYGKHWLKAYSKFRAGIEEAAEKAYRKNLKGLAN